VYAAGYGEAAQLAALLLGAMPESFSGAIYVNGAAPPPGRGRAAQHIREHARIGFLIGEKSQAREQADKVFEEQYKEQFKHLERQVARVTAENMPTNRYFESTIFALEKPLAESAKDLLASAVRSKRGRKYEEAWRLFAAAAARSVDDAVVQQADKGIEALRAELDAELAKVAQIQQAGNEAGVRTATAKLQREWGRWGRMGVEKVQRGELPAAAASAPAGDAATPSVERPAAAANDTAAPQPPSPDRPQRSPRDETALRRLEAARGQLIDEPVEAYEAFEGIVKLYAGTPAARAAAIELAQLDADPDKGPAIAVALAERRARALLSLAKSYQQAGGKPQAREALRELLEKYPNSAQVVEAKLMMMELGEP
jgi:tetratricopeptide (TPR) repeat protein